MTFEVPFTIGDQKFNWRFYPDELFIESGYLLSLTTIPYRVDEIILNSYFVHLI